jgi:hypothetical protein
MPQQQGPEGFSGGVHSTQPAQEPPGLCLTLDKQYLAVTVLTILHQALGLHKEWRGTYPAGTHRLVGNPY